MKGGREERKAGMGGRYGWEKEMRSNGKDTGKEEKAEEGEKWREGAEGKKVDGRYEWRKEMEQMRSNGKDTENGEKAEEGEKWR